VLCSNRQIRSVRSSLPRDAVITLIGALVVSKLDYCNSVLVGVSTTLLRRLQSVLNAAARLVFLARSSAQTTPLFREIRWLKVQEQIQFRLCVLVHHCLHGGAPQYLAETLQLTSDVDSRRRLCCGSTSTLLVHQHIESHWVTERLQRPLRGRGMHYRQRQHRRI